MHIRWLVVSLSGLLATEGCGGSGSEQTNPTPTPSEAGADTADVFTPDAPDAGTEDTDTTTGDADADEIHPDSDAPSETCVPSPEVCDKIDNDCDNTIDNEPQASQSCEDLDHCTDDICRAGECVRFANGQCDRWQPTTDLGAPAGRYAHTAVWTGARMIVFGGNGGSTNDIFRDGASYDPATDSWEPISDDNGRLFRMRHTAVWTGAQMLVWGGADSLSSYNSNGASYDPATDTWTPLPETGSTPWARAYHSAVWTGDSMIVWGGKLDQSTWTNTGGVYETQFERWALVTADGAPTPRYYHSALWTGSRMIVWGGVSVVGAEIEITNSGGAYDPIGDVWTPTSRTNAPTAVWEHSTVWTGSHMIVWGGLDASDAVVSTGGAYDAARDEWTPVATEGAPVARYGHTAVWTGKEMVVWGGYDENGNNLTSGGAYLPDEDRWRATGVLGEPPARGWHTAVWAEGTMIVWGGYDYEALEFLATGGRYTP